MAAAAIQLAASLTGGLLAAHTARLHGATDENMAAGQAVQAFDADVRALVDAYNAGEVSQHDALTALSTIDQQIEGYLHGLVGKPGTAWQSSTPGVCNKTCTVGCCIYNTDLHPSIVNVANAIQAGKGDATIYKVYGSKYGLAERAGYTLTVTTPKVTLHNATQSPAAAVGAAVNGLSSVGRAIENAVTGGRSLAGGDSSTKVSPILWALLAILVFLGIVRLAR